MVTVNTNTLIHESVGNKKEAVARPTQTHADALRQKGVVPQPLRSRSLLVPVGKFVLSHVTHPHYFTTVGSHSSAPWVQMLFRSQCCGQGAAAGGFLTGNYSTIKKSGGI